MAEVTKEEMCGALVILLDIEDEDKKELQKMKSKTLTRIFNGIVKNAKAYNDMHELYRASRKSK